MGAFASAFGFGFGFGIAFLRRPRFRPAAAELWPLDFTSTVDVLLQFALVAVAASGSESDELRSKLAAPAARARASIAIDENCAGVCLDQKRLWYCGIARGLLWNHAPAIYPTTIGVV